MTRLITISHSEIDAFRQCPFKHHLAYRQRWVRQKTSGALARGSLWHQVLEAHYTVIRNAQQGAYPEMNDASFRGAGLYPAQTELLIELCMKAAADVLAVAIDDGIEQDEIDIVTWMYAGHIERYGVDEQWQILAVEHKITIPLFDPDTGRKTKFRLKCILDLIIRNRLNQQVWIVDHKSGAELPKEKDLDFDEQFGLYHAVMKRIGHRVFGSVYSAARTKRNKGDVVPIGDPGRTKAMKTQTLDERFSRTLLARTDQELQAIERGVLQTAKAMYSANNQHERHPDSSTCGWRCDYTEACLLGRKTNDQRTELFLADTGYVQNFERH